jgi:hypothetical protein
VVRIDTFVGFSDSSFTAPILTNTGELVASIVSELVVLNAPLIIPFVEWTLKVLATAPCGMVSSRTCIDRKNKNNYPNFDVVVC